MDNKNKRKGYNECFEGRDLFRKEITEKNYLRKLCQKSGVRRV